MTYMSEIYIYAFTYFVLENFRQFYWSSPLSSLHYDVFVLCVTTDAAAELS